MTKQEKIQEVYGEYWEQVEKYIDENGWVESCDFLPCNSNLICDEEKRNSEYFFSRPKSLSGIENNNGWNKISEVGYPTDETVNYHVLHIDFQEVQEIALMQEVDKRFTHWKIIPNPINPIY